MHESAVGVLRAIANRLGCPYDEIETWLAEFYGDNQAPHFETAEKRLDWIRRRMETGEAESVEQRAHELRQQKNQEFR